MYLLVGLGNPGAKYHSTRHNVGFTVLDRFASRCGFVEPRQKFSGLYSKGDVAGKDVALLWPQTYMNLSGESVREAQAYLKVQIAHILVIHDELDLPLGDVRIKCGGGHAGHNGLRSLMASLGADFVRIRLGIGRPPKDFKGDVASFVLGNFLAAEDFLLHAAIEEALGAINNIVTRGLPFAMSRVRRVLPPEVDGDKRSK